MTTSILKYQSSQLYRIRVVTTERNIDRDNTPSRQNELEAPLHTSATSTATTYKSAEYRNSKKKYKSGHDRQTGVNKLTSSLGNTLVLAQQKGLTLIPAGRRDDTTPLLVCKMNYFYNEIRKYVRNIMYISSIENGPGDSVCALHSLRATP